MPTPTLDSRPEKTVDGFLSRWNAANLPIVYSIDNTKFPTNSDDSTKTVNSVANNGGYAQLTLNSNGGLRKNNWLTISAGVYEGIYKVRSRTSGMIITIDAEYNGDATGTILKYYNNYAVRVEVYAGIDPTHASTASDPYSLIATIDQIPDANNNAKFDIQKYVKSKMSFDYQNSGNDLNAWKDFYIKYAETYDEVVGGSINPTEFVSQYASDIGEWCHAVNSSLQFGNAYGGNLYEYTLSPIKTALTKWMTDFERCYVINDNEFSLSMIFNKGADLYDTEFTIEVKAYDKNGTLLTTISESLTDADYGVYRIVPNYGSVDDALTTYITVQVLIGTDDLSEAQIIDIDNTCL